ncbi:MAG: flippase, partial [Nanoarchaeota archaeon]
MKNYEIILKAAGISMIGLVFSKLVAYLITILIAKTGSNILGILNLGFSIISFIAMISLLGLGNGVLRYVSYYIGKKDKQRIKGTILSALKISTTVSIFMLILTLIFSRYISINIFNKPELVNVIRIFAFIIPLIVYTEIFVNIFLSFKKIEYNVVIRDFGDKFFKLLFVILFISLGFGITGLAFAYLFSSIITFLLLLYFLRKREFNLFNNKIKAKFNTKEILIYSFPLILTSLLTLLQKWADTFVIGYYRSASEIGVYSIAFSTASLLAIIPTALMSLFMPVITSLYGQNNIKEIKRISNSIVKWIFMINLPFAIILSIFSKELIKIVFGLEYVNGYASLIILSLSYLILSITHIYASNLLMVKRTKLLSLFVLISTLINVLLNIILIPKYGINGAAGATLSSNLIFLILMIVSGKFILKLQPIKLSFIKILFAGILP